MEIREIDEEFLLHADPSTLKSLCQTSQQYRSICSDIRFWRRKFLYEGLETSDLERTSSDYLHLYLRTVKSLDQARALLKKFRRYSKKPKRTREVLRIPLTEEIDVSHLTVPRVSLDYLLRQQNRKRNCLKFEELVKQLKEASRKLLTFEDDAHLFSSLLEGLADQVDVDGLVGERSFFVSIHIGLRGEVIYSFLNDFSGDLFTSREIGIDWEDLSTLLFRLFYYQIPFFRPQKDRSLEEYQEDVGENLRPEEQPYYYSL